MNPSALITQMVIGATSTPSRSSLPLLAGVGFCPCSRPFPSTYAPPSVDDGFFLPHGVSSFGGLLSTGDHREVAQPRPRRWEVGAVNERSGGAVQAARSRGKSTREGRRKLHRER